MSNIFTKVTDSFKRFGAFISETKSELKKVSWPDRKEVTNTTVVVIVTSFFFGFYLFVVDWALQHGVNYLFKYVPPLLGK